MDIADKKSGLIRFSLLISSEAIEEPKCVTLDKHTSKEPTPFFTLENEATAIAHEETRSASADPKMKQSGSQTEDMYNFSTSSENQGLSKTTNTAKDTSAVETIKKVNIQPVNSDQISSANLKKPLAKNNSIDSQKSESSSRTTPLHEGNFRRDESLASMYFSTVDTDGSPTGDVTEVKVNKTAKVDMAIQTNMTGPEIELQAKER